MSDIDPRVEAVSAIEETGGAIDTTSQRFRAVRDWASELNPQEAQWLASAVNSGFEYSMWLTQNN